MQCDIPVSWEDIDDDTDEKVPQVPKETKPFYVPEDSILREAHPFYSAQPSVKILQKDPKVNAQRKPMPTSYGPGSASSLSNKTIEEREAEYERARAKIFQSEKAETQVTPTVLKKPPGTK